MGIKENYKIRQIPPIRVVLGTITSCSKNRTRSYRNQPGHLETRDDEIANWR
tara:strand:+ start:1012 stop:1167 length:156 start_codon:yes stop_codon:yes gene_type:complete